MFKRSFMFRRSVFTHITPLPSHVPRDAVVDILHTHREMIELNPLVIDHRRCQQPPPVAGPDEMAAVWYEITDKISYLPGGLLSGSVTYYGCFHDLPQGLQTHVHAPAGLEIRGKWQVCGNMPGERRDPVELGTEELQIPKEGLYLREDVDLQCNILLLAFVKRNLKKSHAGLVERLLAKTSHLTGTTPKTNILDSQEKGNSSSNSRNIPAAKPTTAWIQQQRNLHLQPESNNHSRPESSSSSGHSSNANSNSRTKDNAGEQPFDRQNGSYYPWRSSQSPRPPSPQSIHSRHNTSNHSGDPSPQTSSDLLGQRHYGQNRSHGQQYQQHNRYPSLGPSVRARPGLSELPQGDLDSPQPRRLAPEGQQQQEQNRPSNQSHNLHRKQQRLHELE